MMTNEPWVFRLIDGGPNDLYACYEARTDINNKSAVPQLDVRRWKYANLDVTPEGAWTTAVLEWKWMASPLAKLARSFSPTVTMGTSTATHGVQVLDITACPYLRLETTTAEGSASFITIRVCLTRE